MPIGTWTKHKAISNYENFYNIGVDMGTDHITSIETVANSSLGIDGWALFDVVIAEESAAAAEVGGAAAGGSTPISFVLRVLDGTPCADLHRD